MKEQFATYEISLKLKELGFNEECLAIYVNLVLKPVVQKPISGEFNYKFKSVRNSVIVNSENCSAPLWQQVIDWIRNEHSLHISIYRLNNKWCGDVYAINRQCYVTTHAINNMTYNTYEEARSVSVLESLELIIN